MRQTIGVRWKVVSALLLVTGVATAVVFLIISHAQPAIPKKIQDQLSSTLILPDTSSSFSVLPSTVKYNDPEKLLTYVISNPQGKQVIISEQPAPEMFTDVPQTFASFLSQSGEYSSFGTSVGTIYLIKHSNVTAALTNSKGTLLFGKPKSTLSDTEWRQLFIHMTTAD